MSIFGLDIIPCPLAIQRRWTVRHHPTQKRRRNWCVVCVEEPGCWQAGRRLFMHPDLIAKLPHSEGKT